MDGKIRIKGQLKYYMQWPLILTILLVIMDILVFTVNRKAGALVSVFVAAYILIVVGDDAAIRAMAANDRQQRRYSGLRWRLAHSAMPPETP